MLVPTLVKFNPNGDSKKTYNSDLTRDKIYIASFWEDQWVREIFDEVKAVTVIDDAGDGYEIEYGDYEIIVEKDIEEIIKTT